MRVEESKSFADQKATQVQSAPSLSSVLTVARAQTPPCHSLLVTAAIRLFQGLDYQQMQIK